MCACVQDQRLAGKPVCLVLTKADAPATLTAPELDITLGLAELSVSRAAQAWSAWRAWHTACTAACCPGSTSPCAGNHCYAIAYGT